MKTYLTCPVCDRPKIEGNICPNCETDLSLIRTLTELPELPSVPTKSTAIMPLVPIGVAILILLLGISLGAVGNSFYVQQRQPAVASISPALKTTVSPQVNPTVNPTQSLVATSKKPDEESLLCGGFYYKVKRGDSLSLIAKKLYGDVNLWPRIVAANSNLKGRVNTLAIGEILLVPNLEVNCL
ncbi:LysM peptidoglycan-binding domain-containing protein [Ancylothrix sp. C2]|uniref:LysM peptidoglycan-binding domain-containing protein n=1 Tax=Ancylothrix sp. D3o TaxID=2953691 RepID=UPI0021BAEA46|nr:LysM peptidoglycan-binding domain-containing protein [Ancylothrix sp. D3o]MCT7952228.1 LysM peptidoglycan-binding domain-containing protein [Ancylothrix sp. D3o]